MLAKFTEHDTLLTAHWGNHEAAPVCYPASHEPAHSDWSPQSRGIPHHNNLPYDDTK